MLLENPDTKKAKVDSADHQHSNQEKDEEKADKNAEELKTEETKSSDNNTEIDEYSKAKHECPSFRDKVILAPMVRVGTFPMRLLAIKYGADLVFNQELIDHKVTRVVRRTNEKYGSVDFIDKSTDKLIFRTFPDEKVIFQIGSSDAIRCLNACTLIQNDVLGVDLNMGCPKKFSVLGGMGAALLSKPDIVEDIVKTLKRNLRSNLSVTCKIRLLQDEKSTLELCRRLEKLEINALTVHARYIADRPSSVARIKLIKPITECLHIPCVYNGDIYKYSDIERAKQMTGCSSVMIARGAQWNVSVFSRENKLEALDKIIHEYVELSEKYGNVFQNSKYVVVKMVSGRKWLCKTDQVQTAFHKVKNWQDCYNANKILAEALKQRAQTHPEEEPTQSCFYTDPSIFTTL